MKEASSLVPCCVWFVLIGCRCSVSTPSHSPWWYKQQQLDITLLACKADIWLVSSHLCHQKMIQEQERGGLDPVAGERTSVCDVPLNSCSALSLSYKLSIKFAKGREWGSKNMKCLTYMDFFGNRSSWVLKQECGGGCWKWAGGKQSR